MPARRRFPWLLLLILLAVIAGVGAYLGVFTDEATVDETVPVATVTRGRLRITVLEGGSLEALESHTVVSRVEGQAAILSILEEGTVLTAADVEAGRLLVQLDSSGLEADIERQKIDLAAARSSYENAAANLEIQLQQNASDLRKAELEVRFALLDLARYVGSDLVEDLRIAHGRAGPAVSAPSGSDGRTADRASPLEDLIVKLLESERLEGEARQTIRALDTDIGLAEEEYRRAEVEFDWSGRLREKGYVSREEEEADRIALERRRIELERARTARDQFATYDFPKQVERLLSDLVEAGDQLSRTHKRTDSAEAKARAEATARREQQTLQETRYNKLVEQLSACIMRADRPGLIVYASSGRGGRGRREERIQEGAMVRERQPIIKIPNLAKLGVKADIHESVVERVEKGQSVAVVVDALPDQPIRGTVSFVAPLPNPAENWFNPDRKVYATTIEIQEVPPTLKPGMSAQVEILIADLPDVIQVPVQSVTGRAAAPVVYVVDASGDATQRPVVLGATNDRFVEVREGLAEGEQVLLAPPRAERPTGRRAARGGGAEGKRGTTGRGARPAGTSSGGKPAADKSARSKPAGGAASSRPAR